MKKEVLTKDEKACDYYYRLERLKKKDSVVMVNKLRKSVEKLQEELDFEKNYSIARLQIGSVYHDFTVVINKIYETEIDGGRCYCDRIWAMSKVFEAVKDMINSLKKFFPEVENVTGVKEFLKSDMKKTFLKKKKKFHKARKFYHTNKDVEMSDE